MSTNYYYYFFLSMVGEDHHKVWLCDRATAISMFEEYRNRSDVEKTFYGKAEAMYNRESYADRLISSGVSLETVYSGDWPKDIA